MLSLRPSHLIVLFLALTSVVHAEAPADRLQDYERAIDEGVKEFHLGNFQEAREQFARAHQYNPNARTLRGLGMVEFELRNYGESARLLEQSLASTEKPLDARLRREVSALLERARGYLGEVHLITEPARAAVLVDGAVVELESDETLTLQVGDHVLEFRAQGHLPARRKVQVRGGTREVVRVTLRPVLGSDWTAASGTPAADTVRTPLRRKWWLWTLLGVVVAGGAATTAALLANETTQERAATTPIGVSLESLEVRR